MQGLNRTPSSGVRARSCLVAWVLVGLLVSPGAALSGAGSSDEDDAGEQLQSHLREALRSHPSLSAAEGEWERGSARWQL